MQESSIEFLEGKISIEGGSLIIEKCANLKELPENLEPLVPNERVARAVVGVPKDKRTKVVKAAAKISEKSGEPITAKLIEETAEKVLAPKAEKSEPEMRLDQFNREIPPDLVERWDRAIATAKPMMSELSKIKCAIEKGLAEEDMIYRELNNGVISDCNNLRSNIEMILPHTVCPSCQGFQKSKCLQCKKKGYLSKFRYRTVDAKTRKMWESKNK